MELIDFLKQTQTEIRSQIEDRMAQPGSAYPYPESVFSEFVMEHMAEIGMTFDDVMVCHYRATVGNAILRISGYAVSEEADQIDLFVSLYAGVDEITPVPDAETKTAAEQCIRFLARCAEGRMSSTIEESHEAYELALNIQNIYGGLDQVRIYVLTDRQAKAKNFKSREVNGKTIKLEVMDVERLYRHLSAGKPRDELVVNFEEVTGGALPCIYVPGEMTDYDYALTVVPAEALRFLYERFGSRLLEANVRSFLSVTGKVNRGIRETLRKDPERFMAFNNGIVLVADELHLGQAADGSPGILWMKGMQIVNGGQTTASIYFTKKRDPEVDLRRVRVPAKIIVLKAGDAADEEALISDISKYANSQNSVKQSDMSANKPFHVEMERLALSTYCPDGIGRWFYERAAGSYTTMLAREGTTPARERALKDAIPTARKITKTDLAKFLNAWDQKPFDVSFGSQKNFERFMDSINERPIDPVDVPFFKRTIAKAIIFKAAQKLVRPMFVAFQANITTYAISLLANRLGQKIDLEQVWNQQGISPRLSEQIGIWATEVQVVLQKSAEGRMISEWGKKPECWEAVLAEGYSAPLADIPEVR